MPTVTYGQGSGSFSDAFMVAGDNNPTYADATQLRVASRQDGADLRTIMLWDLAAAGVPTNAYIVSAKITMTAWFNDLVGDVEMSIRVYRIADTNVDEDATWTEASDGTAWETSLGESVGAGLSSSAGGSLDTSIILPGNRPYHLEVHGQGTGTRTISGKGFTALAQDAQNNRGQKLNLMLIPDVLTYASTTSGGSASLDIGYRSQDYGTAGERPELEIVYATRPGAALTSRTFGIGRRRRRRRSGRKH